MEASTMVGGGGVTITSQVESSKSRRSNKVYLGLPYGGVADIDVDTSSLTVSRPQFFSPPPCNVYNLLADSTRTGNN
jgi:hypothetical protein